MSLSEKLAGALKTGGVKSDENRDEGLYLSTGVPNVDFALSGKYRGGGFKSGRIVEIAGKESSGKTLLAQHVIKEAQLAGGAGAFEDHEGTFDENLFQHFGGSIEAGLWTYRLPDTLEESFNNAVDWMCAIREADVIPFEAPLVVVFDSVAEMVPYAKLERKNRSEGLNMKDKLALATAMSQELPAFNKFVKKNNVLSIFLNQFREKPGVAYGDPRYTPGGNTLAFSDSVKAYLSRKIEKDDGRIKSQTVTFETVKNKTHRPFEKAEFKFKFLPDGTGYIDAVHSMVLELKSLDALERSGKYYVWDGKKYYKEPLVEKMKEEPDIMDRLIDMAIEARA